MSAETTRATPATRWRKKPVVIDAMQWTGDAMALMRWAEAFGGSAEITFRGGELHIHTLEGTHHASNGDWIIRGVKGEFYPCKPDIFAATYEAEGVNTPTGHADKDSWLAAETRRVMTLSHANVLREYVGPDNTTSIQVMRNWLMHKAIVEDASRAASVRPSAPQNEDRQCPNCNAWCRPDEHFCSLDAVRPKGRTKVRRRADASDRSPR